MAETHYFCGTFRPNKRVPKPDNLTMDEYCTLVILCRYCAAVRRRIGYFTLTQAKMCLTGPAAPRWVRRMSVEQLIQILGQLLDKGELKLKDSRYTVVRYTDYIDQEALKERQRRARERGYLYWLNNDNYREEQRKKARERYHTRKAKQGEEERMKARKRYLERKAKQAAMT